jgi:hypothetical protein
MHLPKQLLGFFIMKYSPAPWHVTENNDGDILVRMDKSHAVVIGNLESSCEICHANADLIAAAPDLLEALERLMGKYGSGNLRPIDWYHAAQVIQRAKGES